MPENLIRNLKCPNCAATHLFKIEVSGVVDVAATKIGEVTDVAWNEASTICCKSCYTRGTVGQFTVQRRNSRRKEVQKEKVE